MIILNIFGFSLKNKSDTQRHLKQFHAYVQTQFNLKINSIQCDHGWEFYNNELKSFFTNNGALLRFSCPHTSQQNGKAEWMIRTITNSIHTLRPILADPTDFTPHQSAPLPSLPAGTNQPPTTELPPPSNQQPPIPHLSTSPLIQPIQPFPLTYSRRSSQQPRPQPPPPAPLISIPTSHKTTVQIPQWFNSIKEEYDALIKNRTWDLVPKPSDANAHLHVYIDDIILTGSSSEFLNRIIKALNVEFAMTDLVALFLGYLCHQKKSGLHPSQEKYANDILQRAHMQAYNPCKTPVDTNSKLATNSGDLISGKGSSVPYLHQTRHRLHSPAIQQLTAYSDADWAGCPDSRRSTSDYCVFLGPNLISWSSKCQLTVSRSSAEAEYRVVANAIAKACWLCSLLQELSLPLKSGIVVFGDCWVYMTSNPIQHQHTKQIEIDIHFVWEKVALGEAKVFHIPSTRQFANLFKKGLPSPLLTKFRDTLCLRKG
ncbi:LOW QUALITY PROTEIN: hypothetical protein V2J09_017686 [Rumex salicifolius]